MKTPASTPTTSHIAKSASTSSGRVAANTLPDELKALRERLANFLRQTREAKDPKPTQLQVSHVMGYDYPILTQIENNQRTMKADQLVKWAEYMGINPNLDEAPLNEFVDALLQSERTVRETGSRIETGINERVTWLRKELGLSQVEMAAQAKMSPGHYQRIELNRGNLSVTQLRQISHGLRVNYYWLIDGKGEWNAKKMEDELARLRRENELLEELRLSNKK